MKITLSGPTPSQKSFYAKWDALTQQNPLNQRERIYGMAKVELQRGQSPNSVYIDIESMERGAGHASKALTALCSMADDAGVTLEILAKPFGEGGLSAQALIEWYRRYGFVATKEAQEWFEDAPEDGLPMSRNPK